MENYNENEKKTLETKKNNLYHQSTKNLHHLNDPKQWSILILLLFKAKTKKTRKNKGVKKRISKKSMTSTN